MKTCSRCEQTFELSMFRRDPSKRDGCYPRCKVCTSPRGWASLLKVMKRRTCDGCGKAFTPRHNKGRYVRNCSRSCAIAADAWRGLRRDDSGYGAAHQRVRTRRGLASEQTCVDCGDDARQWSVDRDAARLRFENGMPYSLDPSDYLPRCVSCHKLYDLAGTLAVASPPPRA